MESRGISSENQGIKYEVKYGDTWYGIAEAKYGSKGYRQTMEIVKYLKSLNNINPQDNNMQEELSMMDTVTLKSGKTLKYNDEGVVDSVHNSDTNKNHEINVQKRLEAEQEAAQMKLIEKEKIESVNHDNTGAVGLVILNPASYKEGVANSAEEISVIEDILTNQNSDVTDAYMQKIEEENGKLSVPFYPNISVGWDNNVRFNKFIPGVIKNNTPEAFKSACEKVKAFADESMGRRIMKAPFITVNSWNEWTETSYLEPDDLYGYGYLEAIRNVFKQNS